jgi:integrase
MQRGAVWWFRIRLPKTLAKQPAPHWWPSDAASLVGKNGLFRSELTFSLDTKDYPVAKRRGAIEFTRTETLFADAKTLLERGGTVTETDIEAFAHAFRKARLERDEEERNTPAGVKITREVMPDGGWRMGIMMPSPDSPATRSDMTDADLQMIADTAERELDAARKAIAKRGLPDDYSPLGSRAIDRQITAFLHERGVREPHKITDEERRRFHLAAANAAKNGAQDVLQRNAGDWIETPATDAPKAIVGPRLKVALKEWSAGIPSRSIPPPRVKTIMEAELAVRWFVELHGDMPIVAIKRDHIRKYREAVALVPGRGLTMQQRAMKLPALLKILPKDATPRSPGSVAKHLNLLGGIINFAADEHDLIDRSPGWSNPVSGQQPRTHTADDADESKRQPFSAEDLKAIFSHAAVNGAKRPKAARGEAAKFIPLIGLLAGLRLDEIGQLHVRDIRQHPQCGVWLLDINEDIPTKRLKRARGARSAAKRLVPIHPRLIACGLLVYREKRLKSAGPNATLFDGFAPNSQGKWTAEWSKWFGRFLREDVGIGDPRKVFHSFRHSFNDACRDADISDADRHHLIGHQIAGVNARYGEGPFFETLDSKLQRLFTAGRYRSLDLTHLHEP